MSTALPDSFSRNTPPELLTRKTTVEIPQNIQFFLAKDRTSPRLESKYAVKADVDQKQIKLKHKKKYLTDLFLLIEKNLTDNIN